MDTSNHSAALHALLLNPGVTGASFRELERVLAPEGLVLQQSPDVEQVKDELAASASAGTPVPLVVVGPAVPNPLSAARCLHEASPLTHLVLLADETQAEMLRQAATSLGMLGEWSVSHFGSEELAATLAAAARAARKRLHLGETLARINTRLSSTPPAHPVDPWQRPLVATDRVLATLLEHAEEAVVAGDHVGRIGAWNPAAERLFGLKESEALGQPLHAVATGPWSVELPAMLARIGAGPASSEKREIQCRVPNGKCFDAELTLAAVREESGRQMGFVAVVRDVTESKLALTTLLERKRLEERFRAAVESAPTAMVMSDGEGRIVLMNMEAEKVFGYARGELLGRPVEVLVPERLRGQHSELRRGFQAAPQARRMGAGRDLFAMRKDGTEFPVEIGLNPITTEEGTFVLSAVVDITERRKLEEALRDLNHELERRVELRTAELARANEALEHSNLELQQFAYIASHDLQSPLRAISGFVQLLQQDYGAALGEEAAGWIDRVVANVRRMQTLIEDLLAYSRVESRAIPFQPTDMNGVFQHAVNSLESSIRDTGAEVTREPLPVVMGDRSQLVQLLQNLIDNGMKYRGSATPRVHVSAEHRGEQWVISVTDNGIGIGEKHHERIFELFHRLHTQQRYPGTGIGLAICRRVVHRHGGEIWVESRPGEGSTFRFTLPARLGGETASFS